MRVQTGPAGDVWSRGDAGTAAAIATAGAGGWTLRDGAVEAARELPSGARVVLRERLAPGAGTIGSAGPARGGRRRRAGAPGGRARVDPRASAATGASRA